MPSSLKVHGYTIVQHSGYGYGHKPEFKQGLELRTLTSVVTLRKVKEVGGLVFDSYVSADLYARTEPYPDSNVSLIPKAPGTFSQAKLDGLAIYIPKKETAPCTTPIRPSVCSG